MIPYGRQDITQADIDAVVAALRSAYLTSGPEVSGFEGEFANLVGAKHAVAVCNATAALHLAMRLIGVREGDRVITSPNTFLASANCAAYLNAIPDFSDIDPDHHNLDPEVLETNWREDTKAVVAVDYAGQPCNMPEIARIARNHGARVIEDASHAVGSGFSAEGKKWRLGGHPWADLTVFSFHPVKTMTAGEGGMLVTNNDEYARRARLLRSHGVTRNPEEFVGLGFECPASNVGSQTEKAIGQTLSATSLDPRLPPTLPEQGPWVYEMQELGYNYRITDFQCALGRSQLRRLASFIQRRQQIVARYNEAFADLDWLKAPSLDTRHSTSDPSSGFSYQLSDLSLHLYTVQINFSSLGMTRTAAMNALRQQEIGSQVLYIPVHLQPWYRKTYGYHPGKCPVAEAFYAQALSLPLFSALSDDDVERVVAGVRSLA
ncbi:MAG: DegT/DnrJ/EryC1/StrS family aminotransferase [Verrucomicrobiota bacterium]